MSHTFAAVVPNYNDAKRIVKSLDTLAAQTYPFSEIIIVDDCSTDNSVEVIRERIATMPNARLIVADKNGGTPVALNRGLEEVKTEYVFLCSSNDIYLPNMVEVCSAAFDRYPQAVMVSGNVGTLIEETQQPGYDMKLTLPQVERYYSPQEFVQMNRKVGMHFNGGANALRADLLREFGFMRKELRWHSDWFANLMHAFRGGFVYLPQNLLICRIEGSKSYSSGRFHWPTESKVIEACFAAIAAYPEEAKLFKASALLPKYDIRAIPLVMKHAPDLMSPLMVWRTLMHSATYWTKRYVPRPWLTALRPLVRF